MNHPISRYSCGDMGIYAGGRADSDRNPGTDYGPTLDGTFWDPVHGDRRLDAVGPRRVTGRTGSGYALHCNRNPGADYDSTEVIFAGDNQLANADRGLGVNPSGFVMRSYISLDRFPAAGDVGYDSSLKQGGFFARFESIRVYIGIDETGEILFYYNDPPYPYMRTGVFVGLNEYHCYEVWNELSFTSKNSTKIALRIDGNVVAERCVPWFSSETNPILAIIFYSHSSGISVDDIAIDAITDGAGNWIGPGQCSIVRPNSAIERGVQTWADGTTFSPENGVAPVDPDHPYCTPATVADWYNVLAREQPYRMWNASGESGFIGGAGSTAGIGWLMSNMGSDALPWEDGIRATCRSARRAPSNAKLRMGLSSPAFTPTFSCPFVYTQRAFLYIHDPVPRADENLFVQLASSDALAGSWNFGQAGDTQDVWLFGGRYAGSAAGSSELQIYRSIARADIGVNIFAAGSQVAVDPTPGPALNFCLGGPVICFV
jgi:hypothetical protein